MKIIKFLINQFFIPSIVTKLSFESVNNIMDFKIYLHHSHVTGEIYGYAHDFWNWKVRKNEDFFLCLAHNLFDFYLFILVKDV